MVSGAPAPARRPRNQPPNAGACLATAKDSRSPGAISRVGHPGGPSGQTSVRLRTRPGTRAAHAAANGPPAEMPSTATGSAATASSTSAASATQSASRPSRRESVPPTPGRSGATMHNPSSRAAWLNRRADSRESASPWHNRTGAAPCSPATSTAITLPSPRRTSIAPSSRVPAATNPPLRNRPGPRQRGLAGNPGSSQQSQVRTVSRPVITDRDTRSEAAPTRRHACRIGAADSHGNRPADGTRITPILEAARVWLLRSVAQAPAAQRRGLDGAIAKGRGAAAGSAARAVHPVTLETWQEPVTTTAGGG